MLNTCKRIGILIAVFVAASFGTAVAKPTSNVSHQQIESWQNEGMVFVVRDAQGHIITHAKGHLEKWVTETQMVWVVRDDQGQFLTYARGSIETWQDGTRHLVLRNNEGKFVAIAKLCATNAALEFTHEQAERDVLNVIAVF